MSASKVTYAQSSDIKSRTFLEYRRDMKKKAIAELEFLPFLGKLLAPARVEKHGGDADLWFVQRTGRISQAPDYKATLDGGKTMLYEFQYAESLDRLSHFDFKISKVGVKRRGERQPHTDRKFFYVLKPLAQYAFVEPAWIMQHGKVGAVPAWGSRPAYRVPVADLHGLAQDGGEDMRAIIEAVDDKNLLLTFQDDFLKRESLKLSEALRRVVDDRQQMAILSSDLAGFFSVCFLMERLGSEPEAHGLWLVYLLSLFKPGMPSLDFARWAFAMDFLYFKTPALAGKVRQTVQEALAAAREEVQRRAQQDGSFADSGQGSQAEATRHFLFAANLLEDMWQDLAVAYGGIPRVSRIFEILPDYARTAAFVRSSLTLD